MKALGRNSLKFWVIVLAVVTFAVSVLFCTAESAEAIPEDATYWGTTVRSGVHHYKLSDGTLEKGIGVFQTDEKKHFIDYDYWDIYGLQNGGDYRFDDDDGHYEIYNMSLWYNGESDDLRINYWTDTPSLFVDANSAKYAFTIEARFKAPGASEWQIMTIFKDNYRDMVDGQAMDFVHVSIPDNIKTAIYNTTGYGDIPTAIMNGLCEFELSEMEANTH